MAWEKGGIEGVIIGKALYAGKVNLKEALAVAKGKA
jgi:phosphoribosylformimino-5-aminoimidazole carboxamide ribotide isomerase